MTTKPEELMSIIVGQLTHDGWKRDRLGNNITHVDYPDSEIRLTYSGGQIQLIGRHGTKAITRYVDNVYNALVGTGAVRDFIKDSHVPVS